MNIFVTYMCLQHCKNYKNPSRFSELWSQTYCHLFMVHSVHWYDILVRQLKKNLTRGQQTDLQSRHYLILDIGHKCSKTDPSTAPKFAPPPNTDLPLTFLFALNFFRLSSASNEKQNNSEIDHLLYGGREWRSMRRRGTTEYLPYKARRTAIRNRSTPLAICAAPIRLIDCCCWCCYTGQRMTRASDCVYIICCCTRVRESNVAMSLSVVCPFLSLSISTATFAGSSLRRMCRSASPMNRSSRAQSMCLC